MTHVAVGQGTELVNGERKQVHLCINCLRRFVGVKPSPASHCYGKGNKGKRSRS